MKKEKKHENLTSLRGACLTAVFAFLATAALVGEEIATGGKPWMAAAAGAIIIAFLVGYIFGYVVAMSDGMDVEEEWKPAEDGKGKCEAKWGQADL